MTPAAPLVSIVDDDLSVRRALRRLVQSAGYTVVTFASAGEFLESPRPRAWSLTSPWKECRASSSRSGWRQTTRRSRSSSSRPRRCHDARARQTLRSRGASAQAVRRVRVARCD